MIQQNLLRLGMVTLAAGATAYGLTPPTNRPHGPAHHLMPMHPAPSGSPRADTLHLTMHNPSHQPERLGNIENKHILLGITGGIAAYKAPMLVRELKAAGADVQVVMTRAAKEFVTPTTLQALSGNPVREALWDESAEAAMNHIELARWADLVLIAPATANTIASLAHGQADNLLSTLCLATEAPVAIAPAMNQQMYQHMATQSNLETLSSRGIHIIGPAAGEQACGEIGPGRMEEPKAIATEIINHYFSDHPQTLAGRTVMLTTGPTQEAIDPVRYISNHSSGTQGLCLAAAFKEAGAHVILIAGPGVKAAADGIERIDVVSAREMNQAVQAHLDNVDIFVGVAAVADYRPAEEHQSKIKRSGEQDAQRALTLVENPDILAGVAHSDRRPKVVIGFAAETDDGENNARKKLRKADVICLNVVSDKSIGFNSQDNAVTLVYEDGKRMLPKQSKNQLAHAIVDNVQQIFEL